MVRRNNAKPRRTTRAKSARFGGVAGTLKCRHAPDRLVEAANVLRDLIV